MGSRGGGRSGVRREEKTGDRDSGGAGREVSEIGKEPLRARGTCLELSWRAALGCVAEAERVERKLARDGHVPYLALVVKMLQHDARSARA